MSVQIAKILGARVTGVCSGANVEMVKWLGADDVVDYTKEDFSQRGGTYDVVFDCVGKSGFSRTARVLKRGGVFVRIAPSGGLSMSSLLASIPVDIACQQWMSLTRGTKVLGGTPPIAPCDLDQLQQWIALGKLRTVIDRTYPFDQIGDALQYAGRGHKKGHVLISMSRSVGE